MAGKAKTRAKPATKPKPKPATKAKPAAKKPVKKKPAAKPETARKSKKDESLQIPNNVVVDDLATYDWGNEKLTDNQKLFIIWFSTPGQECYRQAMKAARKAGYTPKTANAVAYKLRRELDKHIRLFEDNIGKINIVDTAQRWLQEKVIRGDYDIKDFYKTVEYEDSKGNPKQTLMLKS
ncbi:MAG: terminase small subunit, partial [Treponema sp.]|nr:terminase small subunit [Treponema sp.]